ncbi:hypothetical protein BC833DRAFT_590539 [Globomyces pollinis-pini]|nr:hypothetical protein BC833DRAFT_590539 [Globomyces pollinis-pini]
MKIMEPKTPYIHYNADLDEFNGTSGITPFELACAINNTTLDRADSLNSNIMSEGSDWESGEEKLNALGLLIVVIEHY